MIHRIILLSISMCIATFESYAQEDLKMVEQEMIALISEFNGSAGFFVKDLRSGNTIAYQADTVFPTASMIKVPILVSVMDKVASGELGYHQEFEYKDSLFYGGEDILNSFKEGEKIALDKLIMLMLTMSDNTASLWLQHIGGTGVRINELMDELGLSQTRMNTRTPGRRPYWEIYGWGQTTPREMATLLEMIWKHEIIDAPTSDRMLRNLKRNYWDGEALSVLPYDVNTFSKNGAVSQSRSEVVLVNGRNSDYLFCIMTKDQEDDSWDYGNEGWELIRTFSKKLYNHFEPSDTTRIYSDERYH